MKSGKIKVDINVGESDRNQKELIEESFISDKTLQTWLYQLTSILRNVKKYLSNWAINIAIILIGFNLLGSTIYKQFMEID